MPRGVTGRDARIGCLHCRTSGWTWRRISSSRLGPSPRPRPRLGVTSDEILGLEPVRDEIVSRPVARLLERLKEATELPPNDHRAVITFVEAVLEERGLKTAS